MAKALEERTLYVRGVEDNEDYEDVWDDTILNTAYDKALKLANEEVAKRIAMETNSKGKSAKQNSGQAKSKHAKEELPSKSSTAPSKKVAWKAGMPCRAIYEDDGLEYEAFLVKIIDGKDCIVKFLGYDNTQRVPITTLKPTLGNEERMRQVEAALNERDDDGFESQPASENIEASSDDMSSVPTEKPTNKKKKGNKNKKKYSSDFGDLPQLQMPSMNMFRNMDSFDPIMHMPPPPPLASLSERTDAEEQAISDMLLSWYMTGYYTGLYQGMKRQRQSRRYN